MFTRLQLEDPAAPHVYTSFEIPGRRFGKATDPKALVIVPHSGNHIPTDILPVMLETGISIEELTRAVIKGGDLFCGDVFDVPVLGLVRQTTARYLIDPNRAEDKWSDPRTDKPRIFRHRTFDGVQLYPDAFIDRILADTNLQEEFLLRFHRRFHGAVESMLSHGGYAFLVDAHTMGSTFNEGPRAGQPRPAVCIGNKGNANGETHEKRNEALSCSPERARRLLALAHEIYPRAFEWTGIPFEATLNNPFPGGYSVRKYASAEGTPMHGKAFALELREDGYMDYASLRPIPERLAVLQECTSEFLRAAEQVFL